MGASPSGKASAFDADIRWFESSRPCQYNRYGSLAQWLVHSAHNRTIAGSSPAGSTNFEVWLSLVEHLFWEQDVAGSSPVTSTVCRCSSMVECQSSKLNTRVQFPSSAPNAVIAQLVEQLICNQQVVSSSLTDSSIWERTQAVEEIGLENR